jgi:chromosome partitioning protein
MTVIVIANPKGGVGKSTLSTQIAGYLASKGHSVMLGDADRQHSSKQWLKLRPAEARTIVGWDAASTDVLRPPRGTTYVVIDTPGGLGFKALKALTKRADKLIVPLQPSIFDMMATHTFLKELKERDLNPELQVAVVGMRVDPRTIAAERFRSFVEEQGLPVIAYLRNTQLYVRLAMEGLTLFDVSPGRVARDLDEWSALCQWLDAGDKAKTP